MLRRLFLLVGSLFLSVSCSSSTKVLSTEETESVKVGKKFEVQLKSNPSTGYKWIWVNRGSAAADSVGFEFAASESKTIMCGAGGTEVWTFKAKDKGDDFLKFYYVRPWKKENVADSLIFHFKTK